MTRIWRLPIVMLTFILFSTQCDKGPSDPETGEEGSGSEDNISVVYSQAGQLGIDIDLLQEQALTDSADHMEHHFWRAMYRLDQMLDRIAVPVHKHGDDEAKALLEQARTAQEAAADTARAGNFDDAFESLKESRYYGIEAIQYVKDLIEMNQEQFEKIEQKLKDRLIQVQELLDQVSAALTSEYPRAQRVYDRAMHHLEAGSTALDEGRLRAAGFHLGEAGLLAHIALRILGQNT